MPKRRKKRRKPQQLPRASRAQRSAPQLSPSVAGVRSGANRQIANPADTNEMPYSIGDVVSGVVIVVVDDALALSLGVGFAAGWVIVDVGDGIWGVLSWEDLPLADGESTQDRYAVGDTVHDLFVSEIDHNDRFLSLSARRNAPGYVEALNAHTAGDVVSATVTGFTGNGGLWLDVGGVVGGVPPGELSLADGESAQDRYAVGDTVHDLFVWQVDHGQRVLALSVRRNTPEYVEALNAHSVGDVVSATVTVFQGNGGLWLDVGGVVGSVRPWDLPLADGESAQDRYAVGHTIHGLFVWQVDRDARDLNLSARRNAPGYVEALRQHAAGNMVSGTVTEITGDGGLWLDVGGVVGGVPPGELSLAAGESAQDRYAIGDTVHDLFVWQISRADRTLALSTRRSLLSYVETLNVHSVGDVVSATVTGFEDEGRLWLNVEGVIGAISPDELPLATGEFAQDRYAVGDTIHGLLVWQVDHDVREIDLSVRRNLPGYVEALTDISAGAPLEGVVTEVYEEGLWLDVAGVIGWIPAQEIQPDEGRSLPTRYSVEDSIRARAWQIDRASRTVFLSVHRLAPDFSEEPIELGATIDAVVREVRHGTIHVLIASRSIRVLLCELSLSIGEQPHFEHRQGIRVVVLALDSDGNPSALSYRKALPEWQAEVDRLVRDVVVVPDAQVVSRSAVSESEDRAVVDLGPVNGFIRQDELDAKQAEELMVDAPNTQYPVVVESTEAKGVNVIVSGVQFKERWGELAGNFPEGDPVDAEFRRVSRDRAIVDLGFGLLAEMPREQLPTINDAGTQRPARRGDTFPVRITRKREEDYLIMAENKNQWLADLIAADENLVCEFKAVYIDKDSRIAEVRNGLSVLRAMTGMMNRSGGHVLIGVRDTAKKEDDAVAQAIGWQAGHFKKKNDLTTDLGRLVSETLPPAAASLYETRFEELLDGTEILVIKCDPTDTPIYLKPRGKSKYEFPLRYPAVTRHNWRRPDEADELRNLREYFPQRWPDRDPQAMWDEFEEKVLG